MVATVLSARPWEARLVAMARAAGSIRVVGRLYQPEDLDRLRQVDVLVVGAETSWATPARVRSWRNRGIAVLGVVPEGDMPAAARFTASGAMVTLEQAPLQSLLAAIRIAASRRDLVSGGQGRLAAVVGTRGAPGVTEVSLALASWHLRQPADAPRRPRPGRSQPRPQARAPAPERVGGGERAAAVRCRLAPAGSPSGGRTERRPRRGTTQHTHRHRRPCGGVPVGFRDGRRRSWSGGGRRPGPRRRRLGSAGVPRLAQRLDEDGTSCRRLERSDSLARAQPGGRPRSGDERCSQFCRAGAGGGARCGSNGGSPRCGAVELDGRGATTTPRRASPSPMVDAAR